MVDRARITIWEECGRIFSRRLYRFLPAILDVSDHQGLELLVT